MHVFLIPFHIIETKTLYRYGFVHETKTEIGEARTSIPAPSTQLDDVITSAGPSIMTSSATSLIAQAPNGNIAREHGEAINRVSLCGCGTMKRWKLRKIQCLHSRFFWGNAYTHCGMRFNYATQTGALFLLLRFFFFRWKPFHRLKSMLFFFSSFPRVTFNAF
ncbi:hypothetical protein NPIL_210131 [Nephila pilipes]|uniref:Uncharacterized protein n=1 Tax=Nephila pilipes TaxID=299642 RepID=A0A8X6TZL9_NEPPI|nr:hypothetical protein NPIL_210131 [Nephila pilipes]